MDLRFQTSTSFLYTSRFFLLVDERVGHDAQLLNLSALLLGQVLHGLLGVKARPAGAVAVDLPLVLPGLERTLKRLVVYKDGKKMNEEQRFDLMLRYKRQLYLHICEGEKEKVVLLHPEMNLI